MGFFEDVYNVVEKIPKGQVMTYGEVARAVGSRDARRVGHALHANKVPEKVPCHRVVFADGGLASGYVFGGPGEQKRRLIEEGVEFVGDKVDLRGKGC